MFDWIALDVSPELNICFFLWKYKY